MTDSDEGFAELADPNAWAADVGRHLAELGFLVVQSDRPSAPGGSNLLVALRDAPTLLHFDPERVTYWHVVDGRGRIGELDRSTPLPFVGVASWGSVRVVDRLAVDNRFLAFGGTLRGAALDKHLTVAVLNSPGPIVRWAGHSQGSDPLAGEIGAFFGRLMVPVDFTPGAEARLAATPPLVLYAAFVRHGHDRLHATARLGLAEGPTDRFFVAEATRLAEHEPAAWAAGGSLARELGLRP